MTVLTREEILAALDLPSERIHVKPWGGDVILKAFTGVERNEYERQLMAERERATAAGVAPDVFKQRAYLVALSLVDEEGVRVFAVEDVEALGRKNGNVLATLASTAMRVNALSAADVETLEKN